MRTGDRNAQYGVDQALPACALAVLDDADRRHDARLSERAVEFDLAFHGDNYG